MKLWMIRNNRIVHLPLEEITIDDIGQKAWGLCHMPEAWTRPFFIIGKSFLFEVYHSEDYNKTIEKYYRNIVMVIDKMQLGDCIIIRSSGREEGMKDRGQYESIVSSKKKIKENLLELIKRMEENLKVKESGIPLIVQAYVHGEILGHISNERRFSEEKRDFVIEYKYRRGEEIETKKIHLRNWRQKFDISKLSTRKLEISKTIIETLKIVCAYYYYQKIRIHIEFVCENNIIYIVQSDVEIPDKEAVNPKNYNVAVV